MCPPVDGRVPVVRRGAARVHDFLDWPRCLLVTFGDSLRGDEEEDGADKREVVAATDDAGAAELPRD